MKPKKHRPFVFGPQEGSEKINECFSLSFANLYGYKKTNGERPLSPVTHLFLPNILPVLPGRYCYGTALNNTFIPIVKKNHEFPSIL